MHTADSPAGLAGAQVVLPTQFRPHLGDSSDGRGQRANDKGLIQTG
jgi:hypothetical protein